MIVNKALTAAAVLLFTAPVAPALAHDHYGGRGYIRCLECPGNWDGNYWWRHHYWRPHYYDGWRYGGWRYGGWPYGGWRYGGWRYGGWEY
jgi:hypothetical protein